jgi:peptidoglycan/LPS O-acetylase OafA/YrhL
MQGRDNFYDCIRALAAALVFFYHADILHLGSIGVSMFFCLSGFLITRILLRLPELSVRTIAKFIFRRFMRVWPMMMFQIMLTVLLIAIFVPDSAMIYLKDVPTLATFSGGPSVFVHGGAGPLVLWTLRAEFWFYVFYPLVLLLIGRERTIWLAVVGICAAWYFKFAFGHGTTRFAPFQFTLCYLDQLMYGAVCACLIELDNAKIKAAFRNRPFALWLPLAAIFALSTPVFKDYDLAWYVESSAAAILTASLILHQWARPLTGDYEPISTVGRISYSIYLLHIAVIEHFFPHAFPPALELFMRWGALVCFSLLTYRLIELPFIALSKRIAPLGRKPVALLGDEIGGTGAAIAP